MLDILDYFNQNLDQYLTYLGEHLILSLLALTIAFSVGFPIGFMCHKHKVLSEIASTSSQLLRIIPSLAILFILIPIIGVGLIPALIALTILAIPPILLNTILGFNQVSNATIEVAKGLGMTERQSLWRIELPLAMPYILNGVKLALVEVIASATLATYIGAGGLGTLIFTGLGLYRMDLLIIGGLSVSILSMISIVGMDYVTRRVVKHHG